MDENICRLVDMGFDPDLAREALLNTGNNLERAIDAIYSQGVPQEGPPGYDDLVPLTGANDPSGVKGSGTVTSPIALDDSDTENQRSRSKNSDVMEIPEITAPVHLDDDLKSKIAEYGYGEHASATVLDVPKSYSVYEDIPRTERRAGDPAVLLPNSPRILEGYFAPLLMALSRVDKFRDVILRHDFCDYGFATRWWDTESCLDGVPIFNIEMQRLVAFLTAEKEHRAFASIRNLTNAANQVITEDYDTSTEFVLLTYKTIDDMFVMGGDKEVSKQALTELFDTHIAAEQISEDTAYKVFTIEPSYLGSDLYRVMHGLMWDRDYSNLGANRFVGTSDVLTFMFDSNGDPMRHGGFRIDKLFYPQIYTEECVPILQARVDQMKSLRQESQKLTSQMLRLRSYKGKRVEDMLATATDYLKSIGEDEKAIAELTSIQTHIVDTTKQSASRLEEISTQKQEIDMYDVDEILGDKKEEMEPWVLAGVVVNESQFALPASKDLSLDEWTTFNYELDGTKDFTTDMIKFDELQDQIRQYSRTNFETGLMLLYVRQSVFVTDSPAMINEGLQRFIKKDTEQLDKELNSYSKANGQDEIVVHATEESTSEESEESAEELAEDEIEEIETAKGETAKGEADKAAEVEETEHADDSGDGDIRLD